VVTPGIPAPYHDVSFLDPEPPFKPLDSDLEPHPPTPEPPAPERVAYFKVHEYKYLIRFLNKPIPPSEEDEAIVLDIVRPPDGSKKYRRPVDPTIRRSPSVDIAALIDVKSKDLTYPQLLKIMTNDIYPLSWQISVITSNWNNIEKLKTIKQIISRLYVPPKGGHEICHWYQRIDWRIQELIAQQRKRERLARG
jgi:hypothetical protein